MTVAEFLDWEADDTNRKFELADGEPQAMASNEAETRQNVWAYASIPSVREILLVRSTVIAAELLRRQEDGMWPEQPEMIDSAGEVVLDSIGFRANLGEFYEDTHLRQDGTQ